MPLEHPKYLDERFPFRLQLIGKLLAGQDRFYQSDAVKNS
jgi:hypothetical protein